MSFRGPEEDFFDDSRMSFGEHLEELRKVLIKASIALAIGCCVGFYFAEEVVQVLNRPLVDAINEFELSAARGRMEGETGYIPPDLVPWFEEDGYVPRKFRVDMDELIGELRQQIPDLGESIKVRGDIFQGTDFESGQALGLIKQLSSQSPAGDSTAEHLQAIWKKVPESKQKQLQAMAKKSELADVDLEQLAGVLNSIAESDLHTDEAFSDWLTESGAGLLDMFVNTEANPMAKIKSRVDQSDDSSLSQGLNRALLGKVFGEKLPVRRNLREITLWQQADFQPQSLAATDSFFIWLKAGLVTGLILSLPVIMFFIWSFVAAGLYPHEQKYVYVFLPISLALFVGGVLLAFFFVFQPVLAFLFSFNKSMGIAPEMRINDWLTFVLFLPLGFGIAFQLPLVMLFVNRIGVISVEAYIEKWRIAVMAISVLSMLLTPADPISMILMGGPLTLLYFLGIAMCKWMPRNNANPFGESAPVT